MNSLILSTFSPLKYSFFHPVTSNAPGVTGVWEAQSQAGLEFHTRLQAGEIGAQFSWDGALRNPAVP